MAGGAGALTYTLGRGKGLCQPSRRSFGARLGSKPCEPSCLSVRASFPHPLTLVGMRLGTFWNSRLSPFTALTLPTF